MSVRLALAAMAGLYAANWLLDRFFDVYGVFPNFDVPMHLAGGFATGMLAVAVHHATTKKGHVKAVPMTYHVVFVLGLVALIAVSWEFHEYALDALRGREGNLFARMQPSVADTMGDLALGLAGGIVALVAFRKRL